MEMKTKINLVINADDLGISYNRDTAIFKLLNDKICYSTSVLVNTPTFISSTKNEIIKYLNQQNNNEIDFNVASFGLHLNLTEGFPISKISNLINDKTQIINKEGKFLGKHEFYELLENNESIDFEFIKNEIISQIQFFHEELGFYPSHIDGHQHIHIIPSIAEILAKIMNCFCIKKTRIPYEKENFEIEFYNKVKNYSTISKGIYDSKKIIYSQKYLGIKYMGNNFKHEKILDEIINLKNEEETVDKRDSENKFISVELMTHPGKSQSNKEGFMINMKKDDYFNNDVKGYAWDEWDLLADREHEFLELYKLNKNLAKYDDINLVSYHNISNINKNNKKKIIILGELTYGTGNSITANRISKLISEDYETYLINVNPINSAIKNNSLLKSYLINQFILEYNNINPDLILGINLYRAGLLLNELNRMKINQINSNNLISKLQIAPHILLIAGTDVNVFLEKEFESNIISEICKSSFSICSLNETMLNKVKLKLNNKNTNFKCISQSISMPEEIFSISKLKCREELYKLLNLRIKSEILDDNNSEDEFKIVIIPSGIRNVKDPLFLINSIREIIKNNHNHYFLLIGAILDKNLYEKICFQIGEEYLNKRFFVHDQVPYIDFLKLLKGSDIVINSSISEGQSNCIMEGMLLRVPVMARNNEGNKDLLENNKGILFDTPDDFTIKYNKLISDKKLGCEVVENSYSTAIENFTELKEKESYKNIISSTFNKVIYSINVGDYVENQIFDSNNDYPYNQEQKELKNTDKIMKLCCLSPTVHPFSKENIKLFIKGINLIKKVILEKYSSISLLDVGCGSGIFAIIFMYLIPEIKYDKVVLLDNDDYCLFSSQRNMKILIENFEIKINELIFLKSDLLSELHNQKTLFDVVLVNLPQSPATFNFRSDKYGGPSGSELYAKFLEQIPNFIKNNSFIYMIQITLLNEKDILNMLSKIGLSEKIIDFQIRKAKINEINSLAENLFDYWKELSNDKKIEFEEIEDEIHYKIYFKQLQK
jgi:predicted glycoside hydrolase/deacetylase ChbG (UPF0249 family)